LNYVLILNGSCYRHFSFADALKQQPKPPPKESPPSAATAAPAAAEAKSSRRGKLEQMRPSVRRNKISAATFGQIGRSGEEEKYVMGSDSDVGGPSRLDSMEFSFLPFVFDLFTFTRCVV
jgi:hypothetical protein